MYRRPYEPTATSTAGRQHQHTQNLVERLRQENDMLRQERQELASALADMKLEVDRLRAKVSAELEGLKGVVADLDRLSRLG